MASAAPKIEPFDAYGAYQRERAYSAKLEGALVKALDLMTMENRRRKLRGEDVAHLEAFVSQSRAIWS